jgi:hypothetical protein
MKYPRLRFVIIPWIAILLMTHPILLLLLLPTYFLVGYLVMWFINKFSYGTVPRREFLRGMLIWPILFVHGVTFFVAAMMARYLG